MPLFTKESLDKIIEALLLNAYAVMPIGYADGKAGISLTLFELAKFAGNENLEEHAYTLLGEVLTYKLEDTTLKSGKAGIAFVLDYLIGNQLLEADYKELYQIEHETVLEKVEQLEYVKTDCLKYLDYFFFINSLSNHFVVKDLNYYNTLLSNHIYTYLSEETNDFEICSYYLFVSKFLAVCNSISDIPQLVKLPLIQCIQKKEEELNRLDFICVNSIYLFKKAIYNELFSETFFLKNNLLEDVVIGCLDFKDKIDLIYDIYRLYALNKKYDYREFAVKIQKTLTNDDAKIQEKIFLNAFSCNRESMFGLGMGLSRILLLNMCWEYICKGVFLEKINRLFV